MTSSAKPRSGGNIALSVQVELAARHGIRRLAFASPGRLRGQIGDGRDLFDMLEFQRDATALLGAEVVLLSGLTGPRSACKPVA